MINELQYVTFLRKGIQRHLDDYICLLTVLLAWPGMFPRRVELLISNSDDTNTTPFKVMYKCVPYKASLGDQIRIDICLDSDSNKSTLAWFFDVPLAV